MERQQPACSGLLAGCAPIAPLEFGRWLCATRKKHKLSARQLAVMSGVSVSQIYGIERGTACRTQRITQEALTAALGEAFPAAGLSEFGQWLRVTRRKVGLSAQQLAKAAYVSIDQIYAIERGSTQRPQRKTREKLETVLRLLLPAAGSSTGEDFNHLARERESVEFVSGGSSCIRWS
jgi:transcriptional regulator with XRE-family HTH domain